MPGRFLALTSINGWAERVQRIPWWMNVEQALINMHVPLYRFSMQLVRDPHHAADLAQEAMCRAWENRQKLRNPAAAKSWVFRIAANLAKDGFRRLQRTETVRLETDVIDWRALPDEIAASTEIERQLLEAIDELPPRQRQVLHLRVVEQVTPLEIADILDISSQLVRSNLAAARKHLRERFSDHPNFP